MKKISRIILTVSIVALVIFGTAFADKTEDISPEQGENRVFDKTFNVVVLDVSTSDRTVVDEMIKLAAGKSPVTVDKDSQSKYRTGEIVITNLAAGVAKLGPKTKEGYDQIIINADQFPATASIAETDTLPAMAKASDKSVKRIFDLVVAGGTYDDSPATGGMVLVDEGSNANFSKFETTAPNTTPFYSSGPFTAIPDTNSGNPNFSPDGMRFYGIFADKTAPTSATVSNPNVAPFAFTDQGAGKTQPILACRSVINTITAMPNNPGAATYYTKLRGGQSASCFIGARTSAFTGQQVAKWFADSNTKKSFLIAVAGLRTDDKILKDVITNITGNGGWTDEARLRSFAYDGLDNDDLGRMSRNNITAYKRILVTLVRQADF